MIPSGRGSMGTSPLMSSSFTSRVDAGYLYMIGPYCSQMAKVELLLYIAQQGLLRPVVVVIARHHSCGRHMT